MTPFTRTLSLSAVLWPAVLAGQTPPPPRPAAAARPVAFGYRGFTPGMPYRDFAARAQGMAQQDFLKCQTMHQTAKVMDCGLRVRDPADSANFYLSANVIDGSVSVASFLDSGAVAIVPRAQAELKKQLGPAHRRERSMWEWTNGRRFIRLNWRGGRGWRVISITLNDRDVMDRIVRYRPAPRTAAPAKKP